MAGNILKERSCYLSVGLERIFSARCLFSKDLVEVSVLFTRSVSICVLFWYSTVLLLGVTVDNTAGYIWFLNY